MEGGRGARAGLHWDWPCRELGTWWEPLRGHPQCTSRLPTIPTRDGKGITSPSFQVGTQVWQVRDTFRAWAGSSISLGPSLPVSGAGGGEQPRVGAALESLCLAGLGYWPLTTPQSLCWGLPGTAPHFSLPGGVGCGVLLRGAARVHFCACASSRAPFCLFSEPRARWGGPGCREGRGLDQGGLCGGARGSGPSSLEV